VQHLPEAEGEGIITPRVVLAVIVINGLFLQCDRRGIPCGPCLKSRKVCTGYTRDRLFKNLSALDRDSLLSRSQPLVPITEPLVLRHGSEDSSSSRCSNPESLTYTPPSAREIDPEPRSFTFLFARFMNEYIPTKSEGKAATSEPPVTWLQALPQLQANYPSLNTAIAALSMVRLGRMDNDEKLKQGGISVYSKALEGMQEMLSGNDLLYKEQTLASCLTMSIFEVRTANLLIVDSSLTTYRFWKLPERMLMGG
jgi:hypothetical protein